MRLVYTTDLLPQNRLELLSKGKSYFYNSDPAGFPLDWYSGITFNAIEQQKEALPYFLSAYTLNPNNFRIVNDLAAAYDANKEPEKAIQYFEKAHQLDPKGEATIYNLAILHYRLKAYSVALEWAEKLPEDYPQKDKLIGELMEKQQ